MKQPDSKALKIQLSFSLIVTNFLYLIIAYILVVYAFEESFSSYSTAIIVLVLGVTITVVPSIIYARHAIMNDIDKDKLIIVLAMLHTPSMASLTYFIMVITEVV